MTVSVIWGERRCWRRRSGSVSPSAATPSVTERWSVCVRPVQMVNNEWTRIHMAESCMLGERGRRRRGGAVLSPFHSHLSIDRPTRLFLLISASSSALVPATSNSFCRLLFFFNYLCYSSSAPPSLCSISLISPPSFSFSFSLMFLPQHRHQLADVSSSFHLSSLLAAYSARGRDINMHTEALGWRRRRVIFSQLRVAAQNHAGEVELR